MKMRFALVLLCFTTFLQAQAPRLVIPIGHTSNVVAIAISPDGKFVLTGSYDKTAKLWTRLGQEIQTFKGHTTTVTAVAFSPAPGEYQILTGDGFGTVRLWTPDGKAIRTFDGLERGINSVAFSPDGKWILAASADSIALRWDRQSGKVHQKLIGHSSGIEQAVFFFF